MSTSWASVMHTSERLRQYVDRGFCNMPASVSSVPTFDSRHPLTMSATSMLHRYSSHPSPSDVNSDSFVSDNVLVNSEEHNNDNSVVSSGLQASFRVKPKKRH